LLEGQDDSLDEIDSGNTINTFSKETRVQLLKQNFQSVREFPVKLKRTGETKYTMTEVAKIGSSVRKMIIRLPSYEGTSVLPVPISIIPQQLEESMRQ
jgi:hypothetical protein